MTTQINGRIYKITNSQDDKIYIGSTILRLNRRWHVHKRYYKLGDKRKLYEHMRLIGINNFSINLIREIIVTCKKELRQEEQKEIDLLSKDKLLNSTRAYSYNVNQTRNQEIKRKNRRDFYNRHKQDLIWLEKERERNKLRMRIKRQKLKAMSETERV